MMNGTTSRAPAGIPGLPAPLPSLTTTFSRRAALFGAVAATGLPGAAGAAAVGEVAPNLGASPFALYPLVDIHREARALWHASSQPGLSDDRVFAALDRIGELEDLAKTMKPTTLASAIACLEWARADIVDFSFAGLDRGGELLIAMLDGAIGFLKSGGANV